eukprot:TRINITY_DN68083_c0_g1_i4.p1 TRINITY_DN68083_c0_g1~~TRINITY_DN68083_c0_g1_i4.p1  ORF type:complete len:170 (+),score=9.80 TRINITY_DN68083_c0_g1_i4:369-878(+)
MMRSTVLLGLTGVRCWEASPCPISNTCSSSQIFVVVGRLWLLQHGTFFSKLAGIGFEVFQTMGQLSQCEQRQHHGCQNCPCIVVIVDVCLRAHSAVVMHNSPCGVLSQLPALFFLSSCVLPMAQPTESPTIPIHWSLHPVQGVLLTCRPNNWDKSMNLQVQRCKWSVIH